MANFKIYCQKIDIFAILKVKTCFCAIEYILSKFRQKIFIYLTYFRKSYIIFS